MGNWQQKWGGVALVSSLISLGVVQSAHAVLTTGISSFTGGSFNSASGTFGFRFRATEDLSVTALGVYDIDGDGLTLSSRGNAFGGVTAGLWDETENLLGQVIVPGSTDAPILDGFRYQNLAASIELTSGEFYRVGAYMTDLRRDASTTRFVAKAVPDTVNGIDSIQEAFTTFTAFRFPNRLGDQNTASLGGNILFEDATATSVPFEFSPALGLLVVGGLFGGSKLCRRYKSSKVEI